MSIMAYTKVPKMRGTYPPETIFEELALKNSKSTIINVPAIAPARNQPQPHILRIAMKSSADVASMVAETAIP